jgi:O-antigen/teichoic acid export membrane protein
LFSSVEFAIYSNAVFRLPFIGIVTRSVMSVILPEVSSLSTKGQHNSAAELWRAAVNRVAAFMFPIFVGLFVFAGPLTVTLFSADYTESTFLFRIWLLQLPQRISQYGNFVVALGRRRLYVAGSVVHLCLNIVVTYLFAKSWGVAGVVGGAVLSQYIMHTVYYYVACRELKVSVWRLFDWATLTKTMALAALVGLGAAPVYLINLSAPLTLVLGGTLYAFLYLFLALRLQILSWQEVRSLWPKGRRSARAEQLA